MTYLAMFDGAGSLPPVRRVQIPIIQRDYAQGRRDADVEDIRLDFLEVLLGAIAGAGPVELDFVYGRVADGDLHPLDGQQRLTTLFLLHWYTASLAGVRDAESRWWRFTYETRPGARLFCERLVEHSLAAGEQPSAWLVDQPWFLHQWHGDPTVQAMLVMLDAIHGTWQRCHPGLHADDAWRRLQDREEPVISFTLLPLDDMESDEALYVTMNSRGKPLTPFEHLKARMEQEIRWSDRAAYVARQFDGEWSDLFWPIHGGDDIVDDELVRYLDFVTEICEMRDEAAGVMQEERSGEPRLGVRVRDTFGVTNPACTEHLAFLIDAFDAWRDHPHARDLLDGWFTIAAPGEVGYDPARIRLFGATTTDLLERCAHQYDSQRTRREFTLQDTLMLHAVLTHLIHRTTDATGRLRVLRNVAAASEDEIRREAMPALIAEVEEFMRTGDLDAVGKFSTNQVEDEKAKRVLLTEHPELRAVVCRLEDHALLRGSLGAFELDSVTLPRRAAAFERAFDDPDQWSALTGALLATGDYFRRPRRSSAWQFGTGAPRQETRWRYLLTEASREELTDLRRVLGAFLDGLAEDDVSVPEHCASVVERFLAERRATATFDWRFYLVAYPSMREGDTGLYHSSTDELGYMLCMLRRTQLNSWYRDPVLLAVWRRSDAGEAVEDPWFTGYASTPRWMTFVRSGTGIQNVDEGFLLRRPRSSLHFEAFDGVMGTLTTAESDEGVLVRVPQRNGVDVEDRVVLGAAMVRALAAAGL